MIQVSDNYCIKEKGVFLPVSYLGDVSLLSVSLLFEVIFCCDFSHPKWIFTFITNFAFLILSSFSCRGCPESYQLKSFQKLSACRPAAVQVRWGLMSLFATCLYICAALCVAAHYFSLTTRPILFAEYSLPQELFLADLGHRTLCVLGANSPQL